MTRVRLRYRSPVDGRDLLRYAKWVRELRLRSGVYVIRDTDLREIVYVGESHTDRLYATLTRHFQYWTGYTAGTTYDRYSVEVAVCALDEAPDDVIRKQVELIGELSPSDNTHHQRHLDLEDDGDFDVSELGDDDFAGDFEDDFADAW